MANQEHLDILRQGVNVWNTWREEHGEVQVDLSDIDLSNMDLSGINFRKANLLSINLAGAQLPRARLYRADLGKSNLTGTNLRGADLGGATLNKARLIGADLSGAYLGWARLSEADLSEANLTGCSIYAISAWNVHLHKTIQSNLIITREDEPRITVDNLKVAQFIYLLLNNEEIRHVIDTITSKVVLILGSFSREGKVVLDALRENLRKYDYLPVIFDFDQPNNRSMTETVSTLAHMSRFIIADLTDAKSIPQELERIVPRLRVPVQPLLHISEKAAWTMYRDFEDYYWVLPIYRYSDQTTLLASLKDQVIIPAEEKVKELKRKN